MTFSYMSQRMNIMLINRFPLFIAAQWRLRVTTEKQCHAEQTTTGKHLRLYQPNHASHLNYYLRPLYIYRISVSWL